MEGISASVIAARKAGVVLSAIGRHLFGAANAALFKIIIIVRHYYFEG